MSHKLLTELENSPVAKEYDPHDLLCESDRAFQVVVRNEDCSPAKYWLPASIGYGKIGVIFLVYYFGDDIAISMDFRAVDVDNDLHHCIISLSDAKTFNQAISKALAILTRITGKVCSCNRNQL